MNHSKSRQYAVSGNGSPRVVVAVVLERYGRIGLFRRSGQVAHDRGLWHCITGYMDPHNSPAQQALTELFEETGLEVAGLVDFRAGATLRVNDQEGYAWTIHTFQASTRRRRLTINWEHDAYRWIRPRDIARFGNRVPWLDHVIESAVPSFRPKRLDRPIDLAGRPVNGSPL